MRYVITLDDVPPNLNEIIYKCKRHWAIYSSMKRSWKKLVNSKINPNWKPFINPISVDVTFIFDDKRTRDPDNLTAKFILDGLTKKNNPDKFLIYDDSETWISSVKLSLVKGMKKGTVIDIYDSEG